MPRSPRAPRSVGRPRAGQPGATRGAILEAARKSFALSGYSGATTRDVALRAGVNVATLHYHFGTKEALYAAVWEETLVATLPPPGVGAEPLSRLVSSLFDLGIASPDLARIALFHRLEMPSEPGARRLLRDPRETALIAVLPHGGEAFPPPLAAVLVLALVDSTVLVCLSLVPARRSGRESELRVARIGVVRAALRLCGVR